MAFECHSIDIRRGIDREGPKQAGFFVQVRNKVSTIKGLHRIMIER